jgi:hypothetical protein
MTITIETFNHAWALLNSRFSNNCNQEIALMYFDYLGEKLNNAQFAEAIRLVCLKNRYFPTADEIVERFFGSVAEQAEKAWEAIYMGAQRGQRPELSETALKALQNIGGFRAIELASERELSHLRRQFFESFTNHSETKNKPNELPPDTPPQLP